VRLTTPPRHRTALVILFAATLSACDDGPRPMADYMRFDRNLDTLVVGAEYALTATCFDAEGTPIPGHPVQWVVFPSQLATIRTDGSRATVRALHPTSTVGWDRVTVAAACQRRRVAVTWDSGNDEFYVDPYSNAAHSIDGYVIARASTAEWWIEDVPAGVDLRAPTVEDSTTRVQQLVVARGVTTVGNVIAPSAFTYAMVDTTIAVVSAAGTVTARSIGDTELRVSLGAETRAVAIRVRALPATAWWDIALVDAHWTQGPQDDAQSIPMLRESRAAVVNVLAAVTGETGPAQVELRVGVDSGAPFIDTVSLRFDPDSAPSFARPNAQFLVPRRFVNTAVSWQLRLLGESAEADARPANNQFPRSADATLRHQTPPVLKLHLVPIVLATNGNARTTVLPEHIAMYDSITRLLLPVGRVEVSIGDPIVSSADFFGQGGDTLQGDSWFFYHVLNDVDATRLKFPHLADRYWVGVIPRPAGATGSRWGGMAFYGGIPADRGAMTRSQAMLGHDWRPPGVLNGAYTVAHELGHNFTRRHAPCGGPAGPDPYYPVPGGGIGQWVTWTTPFETGDSSRAPMLPTTRGDVMGYCNPRAVGVYTYSSILRYREMQAHPWTLLTVPRERVPVLVVRGALRHDGARVTRVEYTDGEIGAEPFTSPVALTVLAVDGTVLARARALVGELGEADIGNPFTAHIALNADARARAAELLVRANGVERRVPLPRAP
jgi:hypothetical protein